MNKRPGHVVVTTEVAVCSFCGRPRTLRNEQHQLGALVRTIVTCETCHRTLSSSISVANVEPTAIEPETAAEPAAAPQRARTPQVEAAAKPAAKAATPRKPSATAAKATASKSRTKKKTR